MRPFKKEEKSGVLPRLRKGGVAPPSRYMCIYTSSSGVLPRLRRRGVAPRSKYMCMYILLLRIYSFDLSASFLPWRSLCGHQYRPAYLPHIDPPYVLICICIYIYIYICIYASAPFNVKELFLMPQLAPEQKKYNDKSSLQPEYKKNLNFATGKAL